MAVGVHAGDATISLLFVSSPPLFFLSSPNGDDVNAAAGGKSVGEEVRFHTHAHNTGELRPSRAGSFRVRESLARAVQRLANMTHAASIVLRSSGSATTIDDRRMQRTTAARRLPALPLLRWVPHARTHAHTGTRRARNRVKTKRPESRIGTARANPPLLSSARTRVKSGAGGNAVVGGSARPRSAALLDSERTYDRVRPSDAECFRRRRLTSPRACSST